MLFKAAEEDLKNRIYPEIAVNISSVSILQTYEGYDDWKKVRIGEKVDIYVPEIMVDIEAEIEQITLSFQSYNMALVISNSKNYDKSFGKIFADTYNLINKT